MTRVVRLLLASALSVIFIASTASAQDAEAAQAYNEGIKLYQEKNLEGAQAAFENAIRLANAAGDEDTGKKAANAAGQLYYSIGVAKMRVGDDAAALASFNQGVAARPNDYKNYKGKALLLKKQEDIEGSIEAWLKTAEIADAAGEIGEAKKARTQAAGFAGVAMQQEDYDNVIAYSNMYLAVAESPTLHYYLAATYNKKAQYQPALEHALKSLELENNRGEHAKISYEAAMAYEGLTQFDKAVEFYQRAAVGPYKASAEHKIEQLGGGR
jgi:tetratricopeptide (TPR) repeat protein